MSGLFIFLAVAPVSYSDSAGVSDSALLAIAEQSFAEGTTLRNDGARARPAFARSAIVYDELWQRGYRNPDLALNRAHAHQLAGDLPGAIAALHQGLAEARWSRPLQVALEEARSSVGYPLVGDLVSQCRPASSPTIGSRMSPLEAWAIAGVLWLLACGGMARFAMTRTRGWLFFTGLATIALAILGGAWLQDHRQQERENASKLLMVTEDVVLRTGNSDGHGNSLEAYPPRLDSKIPRGVEVRELWKRGGWVQVRLAGGVIGWLPETAVRTVD
jgi:hypothetical protein